MPSILFVIPQPRNMDGTLQTVHTPYIGVAYLAAALKPRGIDVGVVDLGLHRDSQLAIGNALDRIKPTVVGLTVYTPLIHDCRKIAKMIKEEVSVKQLAIPLVVGGPHISTLREEFLKDTGAEYGIMMDGEKPLSMLIEALGRRAGEAEIGAIPGLVYRRRDGTFCCNENTLLIEDLDDIPLPDWSVYDLRSYPQWVNRGNYGLITSRGCPHRCTYCAAPYVTGNRFRKRSAANVVAEIDKQYTAGFRHFSIMDDAFNIDIERAKEVCRLILAGGYKISWDNGNGIRANAVDDELAVLMRKSGCNFVGMGMESGNDDILKKIKKGLTVARMKEAIDSLNRAGIGNAVNFIIGHPDDTYETAMDTVNVARDLPSSYVNIYNMIPLRGTEAYEQIKDMEDKGKARFLYDWEEYTGRIFPQDIEPVYETPTFTREQRRKVMIFARNITKRRGLQYRFGKVWGGLMYLAIRNHRMFRLAMSIVNTTWGKIIYGALRREQ